MKKYPESEFFIKHGAWVYNRKLRDNKGKCVLDGVEFLSVKISQEIYTTTLKWQEWNNLSDKEKGKWIDTVVKINNWK